MGRMKRFIVPAVIGFIAGLWFGTTKKGQQIASKMPGTGGAGTGTTDKPAPKS